MRSLKTAERYSIRSYPNRSGSVSWKVAGTKPDGTRIRENYQEKVEAIERRAELEQELFGLNSTTALKKTSLSDEQIIDAEAAIQSTNGRSLCEIVGLLNQYENRSAAKGENLDGALRFFESHHRPEIQAISVLEARDRFLASRIGIRDATIEHYKYSTAKLLIPDPNRYVHEMSIADLERIFVRFPNPNTQRTYRRGIKAFFNWAKRHHFCLENPCDRLDKAPIDTTEVSILNLDEVKRLLTGAMNYMDGEMVAPVAIALFGGLRPSELEDLPSADVRLDGIRVKGGKQRRLLKRKVPISPNLAIWLERYPFDGHPKGWARRMRNLKLATKARRWVKDILRHTSISFQGERDKDEPLTAFNNGTSVGMINRHYRLVIDDAHEVEAFWKLIPESLEKEKIAVELPQKRAVLWPSDKQLANMVLNAPMTSIAKLIGVSNVAVKKRCLRRNLAFRKRN